MEFQLQVTLSTTEVWVLLIRWFAEKYQLDEKHVILTKPGDAYQLNYKESQEVFKK